jgi:hypothetical protein
MMIYIYIGSTTSTLSKRKGDHKSSARNRAYGVYTHLNTVGWENVQIVLIELFPCDSKIELEKRERHWIDLLKPALNKVIPGRTKEEYRQVAENKVKQAEKARAFYDANKAKCIETSKMHYEANKKAKLEYARKYQIQYRLHKKNARQADNAVI